MIRDALGADSLPVALAGSLILIGIIVGIASFGMRNAIPVISASSADRQVSLMANGCRELMEGAARDLNDPGAPVGAIRTFTLNLPDDTEYVAFGVDPGAGVSSEGTIFYKVHGSKKAIVVDPGIRFREGIKRAGRNVPSTEHKVINGGGIYEITIEYAYDPGTGQRYLLI